MSSLIASLAVAAVGPAAAGAELSAQVTFTAVADSFVREDYPTRNFGGQTSLRTDAAPVATSYLRFDVRGLSTPIEKVELKVLAGSKSRTGVTARGVSGAWEERAVTYANRPAVSAPVGTSGGTLPDQWASIDVTPLVRSNGVINLALTSSSTTSVTLRAREYGPDKAPRLVVHSASTTTPTPAPSSPSPTPAPSPSQTPLPAPTSPPAPEQSGDVALPVRAGFYYPWFSNAWTQSGIYPFSEYEPTLGYYDITETVARQHIAAMQHGHIAVGISSWWGPGHHTDTKVPTLLRAAAGTAFRWATYYEAESLGDPSVEQLRGDLTYLRDQYSKDPSYARVGGKFVVFVYADSADGCDMSRRWKQANTVGAHIVLKVFGGYRECLDQPDGWHQYAPAKADDSQGSQSYSISPGFWLKGEVAPRLVRDLVRWKQSVARMNASGAAWQLITTLNEWGEGTSVESSTAWQTPSGQGAYLDALHDLPPAHASPGPSPTSTAVPPSTYPVLGAVGDIACDPTSPYFAAGAGIDDKCKQRATSDLLLGPEVTAVAALGDLQYETGTLDAFQNSYDLSWGRLKDKTRPVPGNHEYGTSRAAGYYSYFGARAGDPTKGYYSYDIDGWHVVALNSNCFAVGGCQAGSVQEQWLRADLAANARSCTLAYWHHPLYSSGSHGNTPEVAPLYQALHDAGVEVLLTGHDHEYERFAPQDAAGRADVRGVRQFVVGTGGKSLRGFVTTQPNSEVRDSQAHGVLKLTLKSGTYDWSFVQAETSSIRDSGTASCI